MTNKYRQLRCPKCGWKVPSPTPRQAEAYRLTHFHGCTQEEAGKLMGVTQGRVAQLLLALRKNRPDLFVEETLHIKRKKPFRFDEKRDSMPKMKF